MFRGQLGVAGAVDGEVVFVFDDFEAAVVVAVGFDGQVVDTGVAPVVPDEPECAALQVDALGFVDLGPGRGLGGGLVGVDDEGAGVGAVGVGFDADPEGVGGGAGRDVVGEGGGGCAAERLNGV